MEYKKIFLDEMKSLLLYLVEFFDNGSIVSKKYLNDYVVEEPDLKPIIIIIYNESIFFPSGDCQKVQTIDSQRVLQSKRKRKTIIISDFLLPWSKLNLLSLSSKYQEQLVN